MTDRPGRLRAAVLGAPALLVAALLGACGVPADDEPRAIEQEQVSEEITEDTAEGRTDTATLYLTRSGASGTLLAPAEWQVPVGTSSTSPTPTTALETLLAFQPDEAAQAQGLGTADPPEHPPGRPAGDRRRGRAHDRPQRDAVRHAGPGVEPGVRPGRVHRRRLRRGGCRAVRAGRPAAAGPDGRRRVERAAAHLRLVCQPGGARDGLSPRATVGSGGH